MRQYIEEQIGAVTDIEYAVAIATMDFYFEQCKGHTCGTTMRGLIKEGINSIKTHRRVA
jgi:hypothetical protein